MSFLSIRNLSVRLKGGPPLLRRVSLDVAPGEVRGLVGESGAGKSMIGKAVLGILPPSVEITGGEILLDGTDLLTLAPKDRRRRIGASCALIPQDPLTALNPSHRIGPQITDRLVDILGWGRTEAEARAKALLAEVQIALQQAAAKVTGESGEALKNRLRTGTVVTFDDRNWELQWTPMRRRINQSRAIAVDMESGTIAAQGYRLRVPYGTLLCVSDKPLHGEIKLPGAANAFYERAVSEHLKIGVETIELLKQAGATIHSRKLRAFDEPPFR